MNRLLTLKEAAERMAISEKHLLAFVKNGSIPFLNVGLGGVRPSYRFRPEALDAWERQREQWQESAKQGCSSVKERRSSNTTSASQVLDFAALRAAQKGEKPKPLSARKRRKLAPVLPISEART